MSRALPLLIFIAGLVWLACGDERGGSDKPPLAGGGAGPAGPGPVGAGPGPGGPSGSGGLGPVIDDPDAPCDATIDGTADDPFDAARAAGICKQAVGPDDWGISDARWVMANGAGAIDNPNFPLGRGALETFGSEIRPLEGDKLLALSSGTARQPGEPDFQDPVGFDKGYVSQAPAGFPKEAPACPGVITGATQDDIALEVTLRAPDAAQALAYDFNFITYEWPEFVCSPFNDIFIALLDGENVSFDSAGNPVSVNNVLVRVCDCAAGPPCDAPPMAPIVSFDCPLGNAELLGTGFENHASTSWLVTAAPVGGGDVVTLRWVIYDSGDGLLDSTVVIDNFRWLGEAPDDPETKPIPQ